MIHSRDNPTFWARNPIFITKSIKKRSLIQYTHPRRAGFNPLSDDVGFSLDKMALGRVFSEYFGFPCQFSFHGLFHIY
jgi:hypothetical protein